MLYNPNWKQPKVRKPKFMTMPHLIEWLRTKPADKTYSYSNIHECLLAQYLRAHGRWFVSVGGHHYHCNRWSPLGWVIHRQLPKGFSDVALDFSYKGNTFGAALKRAEAWIGSHS